MKENMVSGYDFPFKTNPLIHLNGLQLWQPQRIDPVDPLSCLTPWDCVFFYFNGYQRPFCPSVVVYPQLYDQKIHCLPGMHKIYKRDDPSSDCTVNIPNCSTITRVDKRPN